MEFMYRIRFVFVVILVFGLSLSSQEIEKPVEVSSTVLKNLKDSKVWTKAMSQAIEFVDSSELTEFDFAYWNSKENPNIFNSYQFTGNEFQFESNRKNWAELRKKKYLAIEIEDINLQEYDFKKKQLPIDYSQKQTFGKSFLLAESGLSLPMIKMDTLNLKLEPDLAEQVVNQREEWKLYLIGEIKVINSKETYFEAIDNGESLILNKSLAEKVFTADPSMRFKMKQKQAEVKTIQLKPVHYIFIKNDESNVITNLK
ncbi:hypothetical protein [Leptospira levettii]|uniref:hypothetical protein n=1 Tax=Leptospira levettii TaxID=2023178 RepID=UPI0013FD545B|nr:hypothetical protein [Leptospira levettii]